MADFIRLKPDRPSVNGTKRIISGKDYAQAVEARRVLEEARAEAEALVRAAQEKYDTARDRGYADGSAAAQQELAERMFELVAGSVDYLGNAEAQISRVVMTCLRKILGTLPEEDLVIGAARAALDDLRNEPRATLRVHPSVADAVRARKSEIMQGDSDVAYLEIVGDDRMEHGGACLESDAGTVDASIEVQIKALEKVFRQRLGGKDSPAAD